LITTAKNPRRLETVSRNGRTAAKEKARPSPADLNGQVEALNQLTQLLLGAIERLVATAESLELTNGPPVELGIDFYGEMQRYELLLIHRALRQAEGSQAKAAALLRLSPTTLNSKLKHYAVRAAKANKHTPRFLLVP
jgi:DNA-binding NtrC family response regulator